ncbi:hypothetical protein [Streptomyces sp. NPDC056683]|uniref:hypothetical protein n=1 Tax=Streptomyces sp. NPDC056683 TaxID=3345910 RepID=UPI003688BAB3
MAHQLKFDPTSDAGRAVVALFNTKKDMENPDGTLNTGDMINVLNDWFTGLGIDDDAGPVTA